MKNRHRKIKNTRRSIGTVIDSSNFENSKGISRKSQIIDISNTLLNKPYTNPNNTKVFSDRSQSKLKIESINKEISRLRK